jgi:hypothetical protein
MGGRKLSLGPRDTSLLIQQPAGRPPEDATRQEAVEALYGSLLGDAWISFANSKPQIVFSQSIKQRDYIDLKRRVLSPHFRMGRQTEFGNNCRVILSSLEEEITGRAVDSFYASGKRAWPRDPEVMSLVSLLFWYLDDGYLLLPFRLGGRGTNYTVGISLKGQEDQTILQEIIPWLRQMTGVEFGARRSHGKIKAVEVNNKAGVIQFLESLRDYWSWVPSSMWYKVGANFDG